MRTDGGSGVAYPIPAWDATRLTAWCSGPGTYYITVNAYHIRDKDDTMRYHLRYLTKTATGPPRQSLWRDDAVAAGPASRLDEKRHLANAGGMLSA